MNALKLVMGVHRQAGFICQTALIDGEFKKVKQKLVNLTEVNITSKNEHVPEIEWKIRNMKERTRCMGVDSPYKIMPTQMVK